MQIGPIAIPAGAAFAPMAGFTTPPVRAAAHRWGAVYTVSEMVSAKALSMGDQKSRQLMQRHPDEGIYAIQLFGSEPATMEAAAKISLFYKPDFIDINMGCPAPKIVNNGAGSALMKNPDLCGALVAAARRGSGLPVTVKLRRGIEGSENAVEVAQACEAAGAAAVAIHGRTREEMYTPPIDLAVIGAVKRAVSVPVIGNGDVTTAQGLLDMLQSTGCDMVMVGRGSLGAPWLFSEINAALAGQPLPPRPSIAGRMREMLLQIEGLCDLKGEDVGMREARSLAPWFMQGLRGAASLRRQAVGLAHFTDAQALARQAIQMNSAG